MYVCMYVCMYACMYVRMFLTTRCADDWACCQFITPAAEVPGASWADAGGIPSALALLRQRALRQRGIGLHILGFRESFGATEST